MPALGRPLPMNKSRTPLVGRIVSVVILGLAGCGKPPEGQDSASVAPDDGTRPLILALTPELPPYSYLDPKTGAVVGIDVDIVRDAATRLGRTLEIHQMEFADLFPTVKSGKADFAASAITITEGRKRDVDFSIPYAEEGNAFLYRKGETIPTMIRAESLRIGVVRSMTCDFYLTRHGIDPFRYHSVEDAIADLIAGRQDAVFYDRPALIMAAEQSGGKLAVTPLETREHYGVAVRKDRPEFLDVVNAVIRERRAK